MATQRPTFRRALGWLAGLLVLGAGPGFAQNGTAIEFYHAEFGHYFITAFPEEAAGIDAGVVKGWQRTGEQFSVFSAGGANGLPVCRFFSASFAPKSSHFYTPIASECENVKANPDWVYEGIAFNLAPHDFGVCPAGTVPLYRLYNNGQSGAPNHRYTTRWDMFVAMRALNWIPEGDGSTFAFACVPPTSLPPIATAEGIWAGVTNVPDAVFLGAILENGDSWTLILSATQGNVAGFFRGTLASTAGALSGQVRGYFLGQTAAAPANVTGTYSPREELIATADGYGATLTGAYAPVPDYDQPASALVAGGTWRIAGARILGPASDPDLVVEVSPGGVLSGASPSGCQVSGTLVPRSSGKNIYDLAISVGGSGCPLGSSASQGIVLLLAGPPQQSIALIGMTESGNPANGFVWSGVRP